MSDTYSPQAAAEQARDSFRKAAKEFETFKLDTTVPESVRALAEKTVNQSREAYERGKDALEEAIDALERSFDAAGQGATAFNRKLIDLAQRNLNSAFDLAKNLAGAKNLAEIVELQSAFIRHQFDVFANQASEIRALTSKIAADTAEPIKHQVTRSFDSSESLTLASDCRASDSGRAKRPGPSRPGPFSLVPPIASACRE